MAHDASGLTGMIKLLEDWALVADRFYARVPFPKVTIPNPYQDWDTMMVRLRGFLDLP